MNASEGPLELRFVGCGDAFGSGGRFNTCFHVTGAGASFLIDRGATSLVALRRGGIAPNAVRGGLITRFHADHFGGLPFFLPDARLVPLHLDLATLEAHLPEIGARRVILTHMSDDVLSVRDSVAHECAEDGLLARV